MPHISVIMACYNASSFIEESIISVVQQTYKNFELIIVDDASTDNTLEIARKIAADDIRIRLLRLETNSGPAAARNHAIKHARGEWLAILDADDIFLPEKLHRQLFSLSKAKSDVVLVGTDSFQIDSCGQKLSREYYPTSTQQLINHLIYLKRFPPHSSMIYRASAVQKLGGFNTLYRWCQDYDLWLRLSHMGSMISVAEPLVKYRLHDRNITNTNGGFENLQYSIAATTCYFLQLKGYPDPLQSSFNQDGGIFLEWIATRLKELNYHESFKQKRLACNSFKRNPNRLLGILNLIASLKRKGNLGTFIFERIWGSRLPERFSEEWIVYSSVVKYTANIKHPNNSGDT